MKYLGLWYVDVDHEAYRQFETLESLVSFIVLQCGMDAVAAVDVVDNKNHSHYIKVRK